MEAFSNAGIYVFLDLDTFTTQIEETNPQWTYTQYQAFTAVIDAFAGYDNIAGFFVANEVSPSNSLPPGKKKVLIWVGGNDSEWNGCSALCESCGAGFKGLYEIQGR